MHTTIRGSDCIGFFSCSHTSSFTHSRYHSHSEDDVLSGTAKDQHLGVGLRFRPLSQKCGALRIQTKTSLCLHQGLHFLVQFVAWCSPREDDSLQRVSLDVLQDCLCFLHRNLPQHIQTKNPVELSPELDRSAEVHILHALARDFASRGRSIEGIGCDQAGIIEPLAVAPTAGPEVADRGRLSRVAQLEAVPQYTSQESLV
mmetsp:Transcript_44014/g.66477  ORF Transcript_44014/g.66477 Transcript_44014/m.66477 type:complete len:201 (+) Transcript_44014:70-672(+)